MAGEAVLELVADLTAPIFLSSLLAEAAVVRLVVVVVVLGTGALVVAVAEPEMINYNLNSIKNLMFLTLFGQNQNHIGKVETSGDYQF